MDAPHPPTISPAGFSVRTIADVPLDVFAEAFAAAFAGYAVPITSTPAQLDARFRAEDGDPFASCVFSSADGPAAILMIARRGWVSRVAGMGVASSLRGTGLGTTLMRRAVDEARARGDTRLVLEVIQGNERAVALYRRAGFEVVRPLLGFSIDAGPVDADAEAAREIDPAAGASQAGRFDTIDLPWQLQPASLAAMVRPTRCFVDATGSLVTMVDATQDIVRVRAVAFDRAVAPPDAAAFTASLRACFPGRAWVAPPIFTEAHRDRFFAPGGWATGEMRQFEMRHRLDGR